MMLCKLSLIVEMKIKCIFSSTCEKLSVDFAIPQSFIPLLNFTVYLEWEVHDMKRERLEKEF